ASSFFVALRLSQDRDVGALAPLAMRYSARQAMVPIELTSIAATPDMRLEVYVLGPERAVPENYLHVRINHAAVNWFQRGINYSELVTDAADEAGGQAFATDFSGTTDGFAGAFFAEGRFDFEILANAPSEAAFIDAFTRQPFPRTTQLLDVLRVLLPLPTALAEQGVNDVTFYGCLQCFSEYWSTFDFDVAAAAAMLEEEIVEPLRDAQALIDRSPVLSLLSSSVSPEEMTLDPVFAFNPDLPPVEAVRTATLVLECEDGVSRGNANRRLELSDGTVLPLPSGRVLEALGFTSSDALLGFNLPASARIEQLRASGLPTVVRDNREAIENAIAIRQPAPSPSRLSNCSAAPASLLPLLAGLGLRRMRRRRR
ncbi:MAG: DUF2330 domain-containing protein, partial [Myxococcota bacterium]